MALNVGEVTATANIDSSKFNKGIDNMGSKVSGFKKTAVAAFTGVATAIAGVGAAGAVMVGAVSDTADYAYEIKKATEATGVSLENMQELRYAFGKVGLDPDETEEVLIEMNRTMGEAINKGGDMAKRYKALGLEMKNLKDMSAAKAFMKIVEGLSKMEKQKGTMIAGKLLGEDIQRKLGNILFAGDKIKELRQESQKAGVILSDEEIESAAQFNQTIERLKQSAKGLWREFGKIALPYLKDFADVLIKNLPKIFGALEDFHAWIDEAGKLKGLFESLENVLGKDTVKNLQKIGEALAGFWEKVGKVLGPTLQKMLPVMKNMFQLFVDLLSLDFKGAGGELKQYFDDLADMYGTLFEELAEHTGLRKLIVTTSNLIDKIQKLLDKPFGGFFGGGDKGEEGLEDAGEEVEIGHVTQQEMLRATSGIGGIYSRGRLKYAAFRPRDFTSTMGNMFEKLGKQNPLKRLLPVGLSGAAIIEYVFPKLKGKVVDASPGDQTVNVGIAKDATFETPGVTQADLNDLATRLRKELGEWLQERGEPNRGEGI